MVNKNDSVEKALEKRQNYEVGKVILRTLVELTENSDENTYFPWTYLELLLFDERLVSSALEKSDLDERLYLDYFVNKEWVTMIKIKNPSILGESCLEGYRANFSKRKEINNFFKKYKKYKNE